MAVKALDIKFADLVIPLSSCPFSIVDENCPYRVFWDLPDFTTKIELLNRFKVEEVMYLRKYHEDCMKQMLQQKNELEHYKQN